MYIFKEKLITAGELMAQYSVLRACVVLYVRGSNPDQSNNCCPHISPHTELVISLLVILFISYPHGPFNAYGWIKVKKV